MSSTLPTLIEAIAPDRFPADEIITMRTCVQVMGAVLSYAEQAGGDPDLRLALAARRGMIVEAYTSNMTDEQREFHCRVSDTAYVLS